MDQDHEHLKLLAIFHFVVAGLAALFACIPVVHLVLGILFATGTLEGQDEAARVVGVVFIVIAAVLILLGWAFAVMVAVTGRFLARRRHHTFCLVMAGVECLFMPFGTVLGVFTLIVLMRDSVRRLFADSGTSDVVATV